MLPADRHRSARLAVCRLAGDVGAGAVQLIEPDPSSPKLTETGRGAAERVGEDDVGSGGDIFLVDLGDEVWLAPR